MKKDIIIDLPMNEYNKDLFETAIDWDEEEKRLIEEEQLNKSINKNAVAKKLHEEEFSTYRQVII